jgi:translation initiation factor IF-3
VPVPRRFDRSLPERDSTRINERIRVPEVRVIGPEGDQVGIMKTAEALRYAQERDLDLVEVAPDSKPPVCRVLDYSKYKYEQAQRQKAARKHQQQITIREIKFRPKIAQHDYDTKKGHVERFLKARDKVKVTIMFRGREVAHPERGEMILNRLAEELAELGIVEQRPAQDGRNMTMILGPVRADAAAQAPKAKPKARPAPSADAVREEAGRRPAPVRLREHEERPEEEAKESTREVAAKPAPAPVADAKPDGKVQSAQPAGRAAKLAALRAARAKEKEAAEAAAAPKPKPAAKRKPKAKAKAK